MFRYFCCVARPPPQQIPTWKDTVEFTIPITQGYCIKVYDGDTITIAFQLTGYPTLYRKSVRLYGIDCPEIKGKTPEERARAQEARNFVANLIENKMVYLKDVSNDKYGRILAYVYTTPNYSGSSINELLLENTLAVAYDGGTKKPFSTECP